MATEKDISPEARWQQEVDFRFEQGWLAYLRAPDLSIKSDQFNELVLLAESVSQKLQHQKSYNVILAEKFAAFLEKYPFIPLEEFDPKVFYGLDRTSLRRAATLVNGIPLAEQVTDVIFIETIETALDHGATSS